MPRALAGKLEKPSRTNCHAKLRSMAVGGSDHRAVVSVRLPQSKNSLVHRMGGRDAYAFLLREPYQTVYDIFCDACTGLSAHLVKMRRMLSERGRDDAARKYEEERASLYDQKDAVSETDVPTQVKLIKQWTKRQRELSRELDELRQ